MSLKLPYSSLQLRNLSWVSYPVFIFKANSSCSVSSYQFGAGCYCVTSTVTSRVHLNPPTLCIHRRTGVMQVSWRCPLNLKNVESLISQMWGETVIQMALSFLLLVFSSIPFPFPALLSSGFLASKNHGFSSLSCSPFIPSSFLFPSLLFSCLISHLVSFL